MKIFIIILISILSIIVSYTAMLGISFFISKSIGSENTIAIILLPYALIICHQMIKSIIEGY